METYNDGSQAVSNKLAHHQTRTYKLKSCSPLRQQIELTSWTQGVWTVVRIIESTIPETRSCPTEDIEREMNKSCERKTAIMWLVPE